MTINQFLKVCFSQLNMLSLVGTKNLSAVIVLPSRDPSCLWMTGVLLYRLTEFFIWRNANQKTTLSIFVFALLIEMLHFASGLSFELKPTNKFQFTNWKNSVKAAMVRSLEDY